MKATLVSVCQTDAARDAGRVALTPELLAATGARYSRNNEGLDSIVARIDRNNLDASVNSVFRMLDYGHQSIADMVPVAIFMDDISIWLAYLIWSLASQAGGQESSTRYIRLSRESLVPDTTLGIPDALRAEWGDAMAAAFDRYAALEAEWTAIGEASPSLYRIPSSLLNATDDKAKRQVGRMKRNYAFDRARYLIPAATSTNVMMTMSARAWAGMCQHLASSPLAEARALAEAVRGELLLAAPHLARHSVATPESEAGIADEFAKSVALARSLLEAAPAADGPAAPTARLEAFPPAGVGDAEMAAALAHHSNRYAWQGDALRRTSVRFGWDAVALAELRDLNRHRTGSKFSTLVPRGFYCAEDQIPACGASPALDNAAAYGRTLTRRALQLLADGDPTYVYWTLLGTQFDFEHVTTADKFIYEAELRTGVGAHYRYAAHLHDALALWFERYPATRPLVLEGKAEPE